MPGMKTPVCSELLIVNLFDSLNNFVFYKTPLGRSNSGSLSSSEANVNHHIKKAIVDSCGLLSAGFTNRTTVGLFCSFL